MAYDLADPQVANTPTPPDAEESMFILQLQGLCSSNQAARPEFSMKLESYLTTIRLMDSDQNPNKKSTPLERALILYQAACEVQRSLRNESYLNWITQLYQPYGKAVVGIIQATSRARYSVNLIRSKFAEAVQQYERASTHTQLAAETTPSPRTRNHSERLQAMKQTPPIGRKFLDAFSGNDQVLNGIKLCLTIIKLKLPKETTTTKQQKTVRRYFSMAFTLADKYNPHSSASENLRFLNQVKQLHDLEIVHRGRSHLDWHSLLTKLRDDHVPDGTDMTLQSPPPSQPRRDTRSSAYVLRSIAARAHHSPGGAFSVTKARQKKQPAADDTVRRLTARAENSPAPGTPPPADGVGVPTSPLITPKNPDGDVVPATPWLPAMALLAPGSRDENDSASKILELRNLAQQAAQEVQARSAEKPPVAGRLNFESPR